MGFYAEWILPSLIDLSMRNKRLRPYRERTAGAAEGRVLDIGIGSGLNLPFYARKAREIFGLDPSLPLLARARSKAPHMQTPIHLVEGSAECIPLADHSMDTIVMTWTGCSIPKICAALKEMRRVLRPGGRLLFVEHGRAPEPGQQRAKMQELFAAMKAEAIPLGERLIAQEAELDNAFAGKTITATTLAASTQAIGATHGALRQTHLKYHLFTVEVLTPAQIHRYAELRGYGRGVQHPHRRH